MTREQLYDLCCRISKGDQWALTELEQSLSQEAVRDEALGEAEKRVVEAAIDEIQGSCTITCHNLQNAVMTLLAVRKKS